MNIKQKFKNLVFSGGRIPEPITTLPITNDWETFGDNEDKIKGVKLPKDFDDTCALYHAKKGSRFPIHRHDKSIESGICLGKCVLKTATTYIELGYGDVFKIEEDLLHAVDFLEDTLLVLTWHPKLNTEGDWVASK